MPPNLIVAKEYISHAKTVVSLIKEIVYIVFICISIITSFYSYQRAEKAEDKAQILKETSERLEHNIDGLYSVMYE